jgi:hypothetical protein
MLTHGPLSQRIVLIDGAMGTVIQQYKLKVSYRPPDHASARAWQSETDAHTTLRMTRRTESFVTAEQGEGEGDSPLALLGVFHMKRTT